MRPKGVFLALLLLMLLFAGIREAQSYGTGSSDPGQTDPGYDYPPPGVEQSNGDNVDTGNIFIPGVGALNPGNSINFGDGGRTPPDDSVPEPSTISLFLFGLTAALALRRRS